jgi:hypothetical protein
MHSHTSPYTQEIAGRIRHTLFPHELDDESRLHHFTPDCPAFQMTALVDWHELDRENMLVRLHGSTTCMAVQQLLINALSHTCTLLQHNHTQQMLRAEQAKEGDHDTVVVFGPLKEALDTARAQRVDGRKWTIAQCRNGGRMPNTGRAAKGVLRAPQTGRAAKGMPNTGRAAKGMPNTGRAAKGVLRAPATGRAAKGVAKPRGAARKGFKTAEEKEAEHKRMCDMLRQ